MDDGEVRAREKESERKVKVMELMQSPLFFFLVFIGCVCARRANNYPSTDIIQ